MRHAARALLALLGLPLAVAAAPEMPRPRVDGRGAPPGASAASSRPTATYRWDGRAAQVRHRRRRSRRARVGFVLRCPRRTSPPPAWQRGGGRLRRALRRGLRGRAGAAGAARSLRGRRAGGARARRGRPRRGHGGGGGRARGLGPLDRGRDPGGGGLLARRGRRRMPCGSRASCTSTGRSRPRRRPSARSTLPAARADAAPRCRHRASARSRVARISFVDGGRAYVCTGTLINTREVPGAVLPHRQPLRRPGGGRREHHELLVLRGRRPAGRAPPSAELAAGGRRHDDRVRRPQHRPHAARDERDARPRARCSPAGTRRRSRRRRPSRASRTRPATCSKLALATVDGKARFDDWEQPAWLVGFTRGIIQGGSSGSGLFTLSGGTLQLRGILSASTTDANGSLSCTNLDEYGVYSRSTSSTRRSRAASWRAPPPVADDHGNRPAEATPVPLGAAPATVAGPHRLRGRHGRLPHCRPGRRHAHRALLGRDRTPWACSSTRTASASPPTTTRRPPAWTSASRSAVGPGTLLPRGDALGVGGHRAVRARRRALAGHGELHRPVVEPGGVRLGHQLQPPGRDRSSPRCSPTARTASRTGSSMSRGDAPGGRQLPGRALPHARARPSTRARGRPSPSTRVGTMRVAFPAPDPGTLTYTVDGVAVTKQIQRQRFSTTHDLLVVGLRPQLTRATSRTCGGTRTSPGWGINFTPPGRHPLRHALHLCRGRAPALVRHVARRPRAANADLRGDALPHRGPAVRRVPWRPITYREVGTMQVAVHRRQRRRRSPTRWTASRCAKQIIRQVFAVPAPECASDD